MKSVEVLFAASSRYSLEIELVHLGPYYTLNQGALVLEGHIEKQFSTSLFLNIFKLNIS